VNAYKNHTMAKPQLRRKQRITTAMINSSRWKQPFSLCWPLFVLSLLTNLFLFCVLSPAAHGDPPSPTTQTDNPTPIVTQNQGEAFTTAIQQMAITLFSHIGDPDPEAGDLADGIAVSSFVDLKKLTRTSSFGRYLAEQLMTEFQQQGYRVIEIRKSTSISIQEKRGEYGLSRDIAEINPDLAARTLITGTYTLAGDNILVNAKVLDNKSAALLSSATMVFPRTRLTDLLLADSASASPRNHEVSLTAMKQLER
jgi:TolB-like protein